MIQLKTTGEMSLAYRSEFLKDEPIEKQMAAYLEAMTPEAKRDLAAQLLRSANEQEGYEVG